MDTPCDAASDLRLFVLGEEPILPFMAFLEFPLGPVAIGGKEDHFRSPGNKTSFDGHLHNVPLENTEQVGE